MSIVFGTTLTPDKARGHLRIPLRCDDAKHGGEAACGVKQAEVMRSHQLDEQELCQEANAGASKA